MKGMKVVPPSIEPLYKAAFAKIDADHDGKISKSELYSFAKSLGSSITEADMDKISKSGWMDITPEMGLDLAPFMKMVFGFVMMDKNEDKMVAYDEMKEVTELMQGKVDEAKFKARFEMMDKNHDGLISFEEFCSK